jgi:hypothetical protein
MTSCPHMQIQNQMQWTVTRIAHYRKHNVIKTVITCSCVRLFGSYSYASEPNGICCLGSFHMIQGCDNRWQWVTFLRKQYSISKLPLRVNVACTIIDFLDIVHGLIMSRKSMIVLINHHHKLLHLNNLLCLSSNKEYN